MATLSAKEVAQKLETTPRTLRKFLRADAKKRGVATPGKGGRYALESRSVKGLQKRFAKWESERIPAEVATDEDAPEVEEVTDEVTPEIEELTEVV